MEYERIIDSNRKEVNDFIKRQWYTTAMVVHGEEIDLAEADGFFLKEQEEIIGLITYVVCGKTMEITSLDSLRENQGIGSGLVETVFAEAKRQGCEKIFLITTNDNINAIRFWQKRGFDMVRVHRNALEAARKIKPEIPLIGENSIPLRHEIEFERFLDRQGMGNI